MNDSTELQDQLAAGTAHLTMDRPAAAIVARGDRIRRRRRTSALGGVAAVGVVGAVVASVLMPPGSTPLAPSAYAAWGPAMVNLEPGLATVVGRVCGSELRDFGFEVATATPVAADRRDGDTVAVYLGEEHYGICALRGEADRLQPRSAVTGRLKDLRDGTHADLVTWTFSHATLDSPARDGVGVLQVSPQVDRVSVEVAGESFDAAVGGGFAMFWLPDGLTEAEVDAARATAYAADGEVLSDTPLS
ncbi:hypothetical protein [Nocardioides sp. W7]|uniref:hypothetical protein n=1 Tax=Nocardioides sp. W7 TaxID=2931390 RepID=UPI001FD1F58D|nr:hypothetical protein [Nocardioides sp. W7]